ncbi:RNA methyltransferase [Chelativorans sp. ZYF759]|uniref:TrmH family RNA methyltransferase n=1 Tax=Chelativorans sp. ZYF759 TaxID=2692213 RepID=UPI00145F3869|nr:RNA methyltransferase [Chelativorans sp. ZYF759]NMG40265.1 RNA methyltransferase [Chelativorans sp. ZYF759]
MTPIRIESADDPRIAAYRSIRERDLAGRHGAFVAEGKVVLNVLFASRRFTADSVLVLENRLAGLEATLSQAPEDMPVYLASQDVMDAIAGFHIHRGILAIGRRGAEPDAADLLRTLPQEALLVVPIGISNHDNIGAIFRNAAAFDADAVLMDASCCDPLYRKAIRVSVGAALKVPFARGGSAAALVELLRERGFDILALTGGGNMDIGDVGPGGRRALLLGTEGQGLPADVLSAANTVRIPMSAGMDSLNVAAASAIALHRLWRGAR